LYGKYSLLEEIDFPKLIPAPDYPPENVETGTQNQEGMVGTMAAIDFLASLSEGASRRERLGATLAGLHERGAELFERLWRGLRSTKGVRVFGPGPAERRTPTVSFVVKDVASTHVAKQLANKGLFLSHGDFYAATVVERLGLGQEGLVRAGCSCYTSAEEIDRLIAAVAEVAG
jgi:selenocysteine lyase/cysteine desulfurase